MKIQRCQSLQEVWLHFLLALSCLSFTFLDLTSQRLYQFCGTTSTNRLTIHKLELQHAMVGTTVSGSDANEPILQDNPDRFCMFPIKYTAVWEMYKKAEASFWTGMLRWGDVTYHFAAVANNATKLPSRPQLRQSLQQRLCTPPRHLQPCQAAKLDLVICVLCFLQPKRLTLATTMPTGRT